ncbi:COQ9 family protein [Kiloniella sp. b19]|uniref:COQ9 family protein n=1 Tax=Kiloniella sp. GXU_MW_B19 TaxID=3141326 RepID=UPI0031DE9FB7
MSETEEMSRDETVKAVLDSVLSLVPFEGWSERALIEAAEENDLSRQQVLALFPRGIQDVVRVLNQRFDDEMLAACPAEELEDMKVRERIATLVRTRLMVMEPHRDALKQGLSYFALPGNVTEGFHTLYDTLDRIWVAAGDRSNDYNFYSKRMLLAGVYSSTLLYWLEDGSEGYEKSWAFLDRRIANVLRVGGSLGKGVKCLNEFSKGLKVFSPFQFVMPRR